MSPINNKDLIFLSELRQKPCTMTGLHETTFLVQNLLLTIQWFNAVAFRDTFACLGHRAILDILLIIIVNGEFPEVSCISLDITFY